MHVTPVSTHCAAVRLTVDRLS